MDMKGTIGRGWWRDVYGHEGHLDATYHRSFHMACDGNGKMPGVVKRVGF